MVVARMATDSNTLLELLRPVEDPEIPGLSIVDLGVVRSAVDEGSLVRVAITPTYSGCPALEVMKEEIEAQLVAKGYSSVIVEIQHSPPWTSQWITEAGRSVLKASGIAPPEGEPELYQIGSYSSPEAVGCPRCDGRFTELKSEYGPTSCKSIWYCKSCQEPFEYFKSF
jgi:ring-1,2-phenylacetyl-CoA epoxidase subunit PaaD